MYKEASPVQKLSHSLVFALIMPAIKQGGFYLPRHAIGGSWQPGLACGWLNWGGKALS